MTIMYYFLSLIHSLFSTEIGSFMICEFGIIRELHDKLFRVRLMKSTKTHTISFAVQLVRPTLAVITFFFSKTLFYSSLK